MRESEAERIHCFYMNCAVGRLGWLMRMCSGIITGCIRTVRHIYMNAKGWGRNGESMKKSGIRNMKKGILHGH